VTISVIVEGKTEKAFMPVLRCFLETKLPGKMPRLDPLPQDGRIPKEEKLRRVVLNLLGGGVDAVIALTDVYTGTNDFKDGNDARAKMRGWVGHEPRFYPHAAQHDFEAWLLPYWLEIQTLAGHNRTRPAGPPEHVNHAKPPSRHVREIFRAGTCRRDYVKVRDAGRILQGQDLNVAAGECPELKAMLNTILSLCGGTLL
jgi:hypothetical protein